MKNLNDIVQKMYEVEPDRKTQFYDHTENNPYVCLLNTNIGKNNDRQTEFVSMNLSTQIADVRSVVLSHDTVFADTVRVHAVCFSPLFYKPTEYQPPTGVHFLPEICANRTMRTTRSILLSFDTNQLLEFADENVLLPSDQLVNQRTRMKSDIWKAAVKQKYFGDLEMKFDEMLNSIYDMQNSPETSDQLELFGKVMLRVHKDDVLEYGRNNAYYTNACIKV
jgi:hypothetical protein